MSFWPWKKYFSALRVRILKKAGKDETAAHFQNPALTTEIRQRAELQRSKTATALLTQVMSVQVQQQLTRATLSSAGDMSLPQEALKEEDDEVSCVKEDTNNVFDDSHAAEVFQQTSDDMHQNEKRESEPMNVEEIELAVKDDYEISKKDIRQENEDVKPTHDEDGVRTRKEDGEEKIESEKETEVTPKEDDEQRGQEDNEMTNKERKEAELALQGDGEEKADKSLEEAAKNNT